MKKEVSQGLGKENIAQSIVKPITKEKNRKMKAVLYMMSQNKYRLKALNIKNAIIKSTINVYLSYLEKDFLSIATMLEHQRKKSQMTTDL